jgi:dienelactone hydrolase
VEREYSACLDPPPRTTYQWTVARRQAYLAAELGLSIRSSKVFLRFGRLLVAALLCVAALPLHAAEQDVGVVLLHGKWDRPPTNVLGLARQLEAAGFKVATPTMPWAETREYDVPYEQALVEIEATAKSLRDKGAKHIIVGGVSFGANGALAYAASGKPVDAIFALSPGHVPDRGAFRKAVEASVTKARGMINSGAGKDKALFEDRNQGQAKQIRTSAESYFSYFDPEGLGVMPKTAAAIPTATPLFMAIGSADPLSRVAQQTIFGRAPKHEKSVYTILPADHMGVTDVIAPTLISWIKLLGY